MHYRKAASLGQKHKIWSQKDLGLSSDFATYQRCDFGQVQTLHFINCKMRYQDLTFAIVVGSKRENESKELASCLAHVIAQKHQLGAIAQVTILLKPVFTCKAKLLRTTMQGYLKINKNVCKLPSTQIPNSYAINFVNVVLALLWFPTHTPPLLSDPLFQ